MVDATITPDGAIIIDNTKGSIVEVSQGFKHTTNNRMEIMGVIAGLENIPKGASCLIISDSSLVVNCLSGKWKRNKNMDLWDLVDKASKGKKIKTKWVKGHDGDVLNELCDTLAINARKGTLVEDIGYEGKKKGGTVSINSDIKLPEGINESILTTEPRLDQALTTKVGRENIETFKRIYKKTFKDYAGLKTGGFDGWSSMPLYEILETKGDVKTVWEIIKLNIEGHKSRMAALRWHKRGLTIEEAINKARVDEEITRGKSNG